MRFANIGLGIMMIGIGFAIVTAVGSIIRGHMKEGTLSPFLGVCIWVAVTLLGFGVGFIGVDALLEGMGK